MPRKASPRIKLDSGIETSANGNYFYWKCNITGKETFADKDRFNDVVKTYGSQEALFKEYVLASAKKYLKNGFDAEYIKSLYNSNNGDLPKLDSSKPLHKIKKKRGRKAGLKQFQTTSVESGSYSPDIQPVTKYPWTDNPDYFKGTNAPLNIQDVSKDTCLYPNRYIDDRCFGCSIYDLCSFPGKFSPEDRKKKNIRNEVIIKKLDTSD
jgi:hypothetical protein